MNNWIKPFKQLNQIIHFLQAVKRKWLYGHNRLLQIIYPHSLCFPYHKPQYLQRFFLQLYWWLWLLSVINFILLLFPNHHESKQPPRKMWQLQWGKWVCFRNIRFYSSYWKLFTFLINVQKSKTKDGALCHNILQ